MSSYKPLLWVQQDNAWLMACPDIKWRWAECKSNLWSGPLSRAARNHCLRLITMEDMEATQWEYAVRVTSLLLLLVAEKYDAVGVLDAYN